MSPPSGGPKKASGMAFIHKDQGTILSSEAADLLQRSDVTIHGEGSICGHQAQPVLLWDRQEQVICSRTKPPALLLLYPEPCPSPPSSATLALALRKGLGLPVLTQISRGQAGMGQVLVTHPHTCCSKVLPDLRPCGAIEYSLEPKG